MGKRKMYDFIDKHTGVVFTAFTVTLIILVFGVAYIGASFEAAAYRKFCDTPVTTWDALFLDLRIDEC
jgi:hypothetical protein